MKKRISILLASAMCLSLAACGSSSSAPAATTAAATTAAATTAAAAETKAEEKKEETKAEAAETKAEAAAPAGNVDWPGKEPVNFYVPGKAGGATDVAGRIIADYLAEKTGGTFVIMNEATGGGTVLCETIRTTSNPNYDIAILGSQNVTATLAGNYNYDVRDENEFNILSRVIRGAHSNILVAGKDAPFHTYEEFVEYGKANPGKIKISGSSSSLSGLYAKMICENAGIEYKLLEAEASDAVVNVLGGLADCFVASYSTMASYDGTGDLFPLVTIDHNREENYPDAPCMDEIGLGDRYATGGQFIVASAKMDPEIAAYITSILPEIMGNPTYEERAATSNNILDVLNKEEAVDTYNKMYGMYESAQG